MDFGPPFYDEDTQRPAINTSINNYTLVEENAETLYSFVYKAFDRNNNRDVILILKKLTERSSTIQDELAVLNSVQHPNIIPLIETFRYDKYVCIVQPYVANGNLHRFLTNGHTNGIPESLAGKIIKQLLQAIQYLHSRNIIHMGIKPISILIDNNDQENFHILLNGFGFAKMFEPNQLADKKRGTPEFMAPEIFRNEHYNNSVDIWSLGITLFVLLSARYPFPNFAHSRNMFFSRLNAGELNYNILENMGISADAIDLIHQMCNIDPANRISAADALHHQWIVQNG